MATTTTLDTVANYVSDARTLLQDIIAPYRYDDLSLLTALNVTMLATRRLRPDLFLGDLTTTAFDPIASFSAVDTTEVDIEPPFRLGVLHGLCAHALLRDQEDVQDERADKFMGIFESTLVGVKTPPIASRRGG